MGPAGYFQSPCGLAKIGTMMICVGEAVVSVDLAGRTGYIAGKRVCAPCENGQARCPPSGWYQFGIYGIVCPSAAALVFMSMGLMLAFDTITTHKHFFKVELFGNLVAAVLQIFFAGVCFRFRQKGMRARCAPISPAEELEECVKGKILDTQPNLMLIVGSIAIVCAVAFFVSVFFVFSKLTSPPAPATAPAAPPQA